jgi:uncharacterized protein (DUF58 family)
MRNRFFRWVRQWARRRYGTDPDPSTISTRRIYILPTRLGVAFALMLFAMFIGAMNYANNLALGLAFLLGGLALTAMHHCHRNLAGVRVRSAGSEPVFAGERATFRIALENTATLVRPELEIRNEHTRVAPMRIDPGARAIMELKAPAPRRGYLHLEQFEVATRHPFGLFRAWTYLNMDLRCVVYPRPAPKGRKPPPFETDTGGAQDSTQGDEEFAGLRAFHAGDSTRRIAWKAYARDESLQVKVFAGTAVTSHRFDWNTLQGLDAEMRLAQLCRWIEDAYAAGRAFGMKLPGVDIPENIGPAHRQRCLTALALFEIHAGA